MRLLGGGWLISSPPGDRPNVEIKRQKLSRIHGSMPRRRIQTETFPLQGGMKQSAGDCGLILSICSHCDKAIASSSRLRRSTSEKTPDSADLTLTLS